MSAEQKKDFYEVLDYIQGKRILVANRGIPARRITRTIQEMSGAIPVVTATDVDKTSPATTGAHELMLLGENPRAYLDIARIIRKAKARGVIAIHPGWGFAAEDETFPERCKKAGIIFLGPDAGAMRTLGNKVEVRKLAKKLGVPVVPGSEGSVTVAEARVLAEEIGYPVMLKAEGGGGGRGIYEVFSPEEMEDAFLKASTQAQASFGNARLYVERLLTNIRHLEIQVAADKHGNVFAFDERDCTVQRNHQKLVEITPSPWSGMTEELRARLKEYATLLVREVGYYSLATVEFLVDGEGRPYLIEVNTRLQVEHGITEIRYGVDLVEEQIAIALGAELRFNKEQTKPSRYACQVRINCEDPQDNFSPNSGRISRYVSPGGPGIRIDSCICAGYDFPSQYDSAASLLVAYGGSWKKTLRVLERALKEYVIGGVKTTIGFHRQIIRNRDFRDGNLNTNFIATHPELMRYTDEEAEALRLSRLIARISAKGYNEYVKLGEYRGVDDKRIGAFDPVLPRIYPKKDNSPYPRYDRTATLDYIRDSEHVHFTDTTARDITQSNSGNRFRLAEDMLIAQYLDNCGFFSLENGGGAHFHVAMLANMTYPFAEAKAWNEAAPGTLKQILIRSTNVLGYKPQPRNLMQRTAEMVCDHYDVIRCFDFLNHIENMRPFAEVAMSRKENIFEPAISLTWSKKFTINYYLQVADEILQMISEVSGLRKKQAEASIILGLKDMAGVCPPRFMRELTEALRKTYPRLVLHYHRHYTDGLFVPTCGAAVEAGAHIVDTAIGSSVRWYGQGDVLSTAAYIEGEMGRPVRLNKEMIRTCNFVLKQIMPYYDKYAAPYFQGIDYDVTQHGMPGGATSSSQEGALKQGYIHLLPYMLKFLAGTREIVHYHDVTPGSQITWNTAFLAVTGAYKRGGERAVEDLLDILQYVVATPEEELSKSMKRNRLQIYCDANDAFRNLLLGEFGRLPLGFPPDWVYESAFGPDYKKALAKRTEASPLLILEDADLKKEETALARELCRNPTAEELVMYLNHPADALATIRFNEEFGNPNNIPLDVWFEGLQTGQEVVFLDSTKKPHTMTVLHIAEQDNAGMREVRYELDGEICAVQVKVKEGAATQIAAGEMADPDNIYHIAAPSNGDLWVMYAEPGEVVEKGEELFNVSIMKQEKAVLAPVDALVKRVTKSANFKDDKKMVPVTGGELLVELAPVPNTCSGCQWHIVSEEYIYCPGCGTKLK